MKGSVQPARVRDVDLATTSQLARATARSSSPILVAFLGDSILYGAGGNLGFPGPRAPLWQLLREARDVQFVGTLRDGWPGEGGTPTWYQSRYVLGDWGHDGHSGAKIEDLASQWGAYAAAYAASDWPIDCVFLLIGANNLSTGETAASALAKLPALLGAIRASYPSAVIFLCTIPPVPSHTAATATFNAGLLSLSTLSVIVVDAASDLEAAELNGDVHPSAPGNTKIAERMFVAFERVFPIRRGRAFPRAFALRNPQVATRFTDAGDYATLGKLVTAGVEPGAGNFALAVTVAPTALTSVGTLNTIAGYNQDAYSPGGIAILADGPHVTVYLDGGSPRLYRVENLLSTSATTRLVLTGDVSDGTLALWANGLLRAQATGISWSFTGSKKAYVGNGPGFFASTLGYYRDFTVAKGSAVPGYRDVALRLAIEADYFEGEILPGASSLFRLNQASGTDLADLVGGTDGGTLAGSGSTSNNAKATPWDWT